MTDEKHQPLEYSIVKTIKGSELVGKDLSRYSKSRSSCVQDSSDFQTTEMAWNYPAQPAYGEDDYESCRKMMYQYCHWLMAMEITQKVDGWVAIMEVNKEIAKTLAKKVGR